MTVLSRNLMLVLGSTAIGAVLASAPAFSDTIIGAPNKAAYSLSGNGVDAISGNTYIASSDGTSPRAWGVLVYGNSTLDTSNTIIKTTGSKAHGIQVGQFGGNNATGSDQSIVTLGEGVTVSTGGADSFGLHAVDGGTINGSVTIGTQGRNGFGAFAESRSTINLSNSVIGTIGEKAFGLIANNDKRNDGGRITATNVEITTTGDAASGAYVDNGGSISLTDSTIATEGYRAHGAEALSGGSIEITGGSITTEGDQARGLQATDSGTQIVANNVTIKTTGGQRNNSGAEGARAQSGANIVLNGGSITTDGERAYGLIATNGATVTSSADITTNGKVAHGVQAGGAGENGIGSTAATINLTGGTITINAPEASWAAALHTVDSGVINADNINIVSNSYGVLSETASTVTLDNSSVTLTSGVGALVANNDRKLDAAGVIVATNTAIVTSGDNVVGALAAAGGSITINGGSITTTGENAFALAVANSGTINVTRASLSSANAATVGVLVADAGDVTNINFGAGTVVTQNNGTLLQVDRTGTGVDGVVNFTLDAGSVSIGDIVDALAIDGEGYTNFVVQNGAQWTGTLKGIKDITAKPGSALTFDEHTHIVGDVHGTQSTFAFSSEGATIGGDFTLTEGSLTTGGTVAAPITVEGHVAVDETSVMGGNWEIKGNLQSSGMITPGNSIGQVSVAQNLTLDDASVYNVEINAQGESDLIKVGETAYLAGSVVVNPLGGHLLDTPYTILSANDFAGTTFSSVSWEGSTTFIDPRLSYDANNVLLTIERNDVAFSSVTETRNQYATAEAIDGLSLNSPVANSIAFLGAADARQAFDQLSGDAYASYKTGLIDSANLTADAINNRLRAAFEGVAAKQTPVLSFAQSPKGSAPQPFEAVSPAVPSHDYAVWATGFGSWTDYDGNTNAGGLKTSTGGFLSGVDVGLSSGWRVGLVGGYSQTDLDAKGRFASADSDNWHLGVYGGNQWGALAFRAGLVHTWHSIDASRSVAYPGLSDSLEADYDARTLQAFGELGYRIDTASASFEPFANLAHVRLHTDGFNERGGAAALAVDSETTNTTFTTLGLRASTQLPLGSTEAKLKGTIGWRHAYGDITPESTQAFAGSNAFTVEGVAIAKDAALVEAGFDIAITEASTFGLNYVGQFGSGAKQNGFNASFNVRF